jgi:rsbT co-antagonist protein RsbR
MSSNSQLADVFEKRENEIASKWLEQQFANGRKVSPTARDEAGRRSREFLSALKNATRHAGTTDINNSAWTPVREFLADLSASQAKNGATPTETASFVFSLKQPIFVALREEHAKDPSTLADSIWDATELLDKLGLLTTEMHQKSRESVIARQRQEMLELSTPVVRLWENILALPLIGTLDSARTQIVMQNLLEAIVQTRSDFAIIDITGVPVVDTLVAQHLLKTVAAARLMGADCLISGIRPQIAQTIIHLGVDLTNVTTKATLADAFALALKRSGQIVVRENAKPSAQR